MSSAPIRILTAAVMQYNAQHRSTCKPTADGKRFWLYFLLEYCILLASNRFILLQVKHPQWRVVSLSALCHLQVEDTLPTFLASNKEWGCCHDRWETEQNPDVPGQQFHVLWGLLRLFSSITVRCWNNYCTIKYASANTTIRKTYRV